MNVFHRYTLASLKKNRARTWVTIIGILLSVSLFTAVIEGAYSGVQFLIRVQESTTGSFHGIYSPEEPDGGEWLKSSADVAETTVWTNGGWALIGSDNADKPYLHLVCVEENFTDLVAVQLVTGRMPEQPGEILLPEHLGHNGGVYIPVGTTLDLSVGSRQSEGMELQTYVPYLPQEEELVQLQEMTFTVVGIYQRFGYDLEEYECPGYTALVCGGAEKGAAQQLFFCLKQPSVFYDWAQENLNDGTWTANDTLLRYYGASRYANLSTVIYGFMGVLLFLIFFGSVSLIYNSFSISVSERTRQFGMLKSVGATKKQIRASVVDEALILCAVAIPAGLVLGCGGIGVTLYCLRDSFGFVGGADNVQMRLVLHPLALLAAAAVGLLTALVSAWIPARRAVSVSAIDAIRQTKDVTAGSRDVRTWPLMRCIFGFEGMLAAKNFKRNRRRYRATVISLFMSVTLFISSSSFCAYLTDTAGYVEAGNSQVDLRYYMPENVAENGWSKDEVLQLFAGIGGVDEVVCYRYERLPLAFAAESVREESSALACWRQEEDGALQLYADIVFVDDSRYRQLAGECGIDAAEDGASAALVWDYTTGILIGISEDGEEAMRYSVHLLRDAAFPAEAVCRQWKTIDGYMTTYGTRTVDGQLMCEYYTQEYAQQVSDRGETLDPEEALLIPWEEAMESTSLTLGARLPQ